MPNPKDEAQLRDDLDSALDRFSVSGESSGAPAWLGALKERLTDLDDAFASPTATGLASDRIRRDSGLDEPVSSPRGAQLEVSAARKLPVRGWLLAAALAVLAFGLGLFGANHGWWTDDGNRPTGASIAAVSTSAATAVVSEMVVTPSTCTLEPLTRERYDALVGTATPLPLDVFQADLAAKTDAFGKKLDLRIVNGNAVITAGSGLPPDVARELEATLSSWIACGNAGNELALSGIMSDDYIRMINDPDTWFAEIEVTQEVTPTQVTEMKFEQVRLLADGSVVAVVLDSFSPSDETTSESEEMPTGTVAFQGMIYLFVPTSKGWRLDFAQSGYVLPIKNEAISATPAPDAEYVNEMVVTPSACTFEPLTRAQLGQIVGTATPIAEEEYDNLQVAITNELLPALDLKVVDGNVQITGGSAVPREIVDEVAGVLANYIACGNSGDLSAAIRILSDDFLARIPDQDQFLADLESPSTPEAEPLAELHVTQLRMLPDVRIVLTWAIDLSSSSGIENSPEPTPQGTVALDGILLVFVKDTDGWKLDFQRGGEIFRLPAGKAVAATEATPATFVDEMVVTPSSCTLEPLTQERYAEIMGTATPIVDEAIVDAGIVMSNALKAELDAQVVGGQFVFRGGSAVPSEIADEILQSAASYLGCWNDGNFLATLEFLTDDLLMATQDLRRWQESMALVGPGGETTLPEMRLTQLRLLSDGRVAAVWAGPFPDNSFEHIPLLGTETPDGTIRTDGPIYVFKLTSEGWRLDWIEAAGLYQLPPPAGPVIGTPLAD